MNTILYTATGAVAEIVINRPQALNALDPDTFEQLRDALVRARDDIEIRVIILSGAGDRAFCVGADLKQTMPSTNSSFASAFWRSDKDAVTSGMYIRALDLTRLDLWKPLIAAINGYCVGGGLELALQCDIRLATPTATFGLPEARVGSIPAVGGIQRLVRAVPPGVAMKMLLTGERIDGEAAARWGLVSDLVSSRELMPTAREIAAKVAENAPLSIQAIKQLEWYGRNLPMRDAIYMEQMTWGVLRDTNDRIEGRKAFAAKRPPVFEGQ